MLTSPCLFYISYYSWHHVELGEEYRKKNGHRKKNGLNLIKVIALSSMEAGTMSVSYPQCVG